MPCLFAAVILLFPRVVLVLMFLFTRYLEHAYHGLLVPLAGFICLPLTTVVYAYMVNNGIPTVGMNLAWLLLAVLIDLGSIGGGYRSRRG